MQMLLVVLIGKEGPLRRLSKSAFAVRGSADRVVMRGYGYGYGYGVFISWPGISSRHHFSSYVKFQENDRGQEVIPLIQGGIRDVSPQGEARLGTPERSTVSVQAVPVAALRVCWSNVKCNLPSKNRVNYRCWVI